MRYGPMGVSRRATIGDMLTQPSGTPAAQQPRMPAPRRRVSEDIIRTTTNFRPSPMPMRSRGRVR
jgi:hypothetical protein